MKKKTIGLLSLFILCMLCFLSACIPQNSPPLDNEEEHEHQMGEWENFRLPTCDEEGEKRSTCEECDFYLSESIPKKEHEMGLWFTAKEPTCSEEGEKRVECKYCDYYENGPLPVLNHEFADWVNLGGANCTEMGKCRRECKNCDAFEEQERLYHAFGDWNVIEEPSCTEYGIACRECTLCDASEEQELKMLPHTFGNFESVKEPTCQEKGLKTRTCEDCGVQENKMIDTVPHHFGEWVIEVIADCAKQGLKRRQCIWCEFFENESIPKTEHKVNTITKEPTETEYGYQKVGCENCNTYNSVEYFPATKTTLGLTFETLYNDTYGEIVYVTGRGTSTDKDIVVPVVYEGKLVFGVSMYAFENEDITSIVLPDTVRNINECAFLGCASLSSVTLGEGVSILPGAFFGIQDEAFVEYNGVRYLGAGENPYYYCVELIDDRKTSVTIHERTNYICGGAFANSDLVSVTIPDSVKEIGIRAFASCLYLKNADLGEGVEKICEMAFDNCRVMSDVTFSPEIQTILPNAFSACKKLKAVHYPASLSQFEKIEWWHADDESIYTVYCTNGEVIPNHPGEHEHIYTKNAISFDGVTMRSLCDLCEEEKISNVPACEHHLENTIRDDCDDLLCYVCDKCKVLFSIKDVMTVKITDIDENKIAMLVTSKVSGVVCEMMPYTLSEYTIIDESALYDSGKLPEEQCQMIGTMTLGENITVLKDISFAHIKKLVISSSVKQMQEHCIDDLYFLDEIYFEGDLPQIFPNSLYVRHVIDYNRLYEPCAYYNKGALGFEEYGYKLGAFTLYQVGEEIDELPSYTINELSTLNAQRAVEIALELFERGKDNRPFLQFIPFTSIYAYKQIKDFTLELTKDCTDDLCRARVIYDWLVENIEYDDKAMYYTPDCVFTTKKAVCAGYAMLYHDMLCAVKIPSLYVTGASVFGSTITANELMYYPCNYPGEKYGIGHGWNLVYIDGDAVMVDATWGDFDLSPEEIANSGRVTLAIQGISVLPKNVDPRSCDEVLYYEDGEIFYMEDGMISVFDGKDYIVNYAAQFNYELRIPSDGRVFDEREIGIKNGYHDIFADYVEFNPYYSNYYASDFLAYAYITVYKYLAFEQYYYGEDFVIEHSDQFFTKDGLLYSILNESEVEVIGMIQQGGAITIPETANGYRVTKIAQNAFSYTSITAVSLPNSIKEIASQAFFGCQLLERVVLPDSLEILGVGVFASCLSLREVYLPNSLKTVGLFDNHQLFIIDETFYDIDPEQLKVYYAGTEEDFDKIHFTDPYTNPEELGFDSAQYEHFKSYVVFEYVENVE